MKNTFDQQFETSLEEYINTAVEVEKKEYHPGLRPFAAFEQEIRAKMDSALRGFQTNYTNGYRALAAEIKREMETSETKENLLEQISVHPEKLKVFENSEALMNAFQEGRAVYELLGFSEKTLNIFYHAGCRLMENKEFKKAVDAFYFLITLAPEIYQFWICLGHCYKNLEEYETALEVFLQAIDIDATQVAAYIDIIDLFVQMHDFHEASEFCHMGLNFAHEYQKEPWAAGLQAALEEKAHNIS